MADNTPVTDEMVTSEQTEALVTPEVATPESLEVPPTGAELLKIAEAAKAAGEATIETVPNPSEDETVLKKRLNGAITEIEKKNMEARRFVEMQADIVKDNPELIHKIAAGDPMLANRVVEKVWGNEGVRSYKQLVEHIKLEELKETDPDTYETKKELADIKRLLANREDNDRKVATETFFKGKGVIASEYDPTYAKVMEELGSINPNLVKADYPAALERAYILAGQGQMAPIRGHIAPPVMKAGGGAVPPPVPEAKKPVDGQSQWLAESLNKQLGYNIKL
jgi:hypothetical protein